jgi:hypothetical protein
VRRNKPQLKAGAWRAGCMLADGSTQHARCVLGVLLWHQTHHLRSAPG